ncbi:MAG TPA: GMC family oxidoreductase [Gemmatimonadales bacterium]|jgi:choline dehydrogenase-like flavoprotein
MRTERTDVLIIGTGFGAAAPALRLASAGLTVTMIEKGPHIDPFTDFRQTQDPRYIMRYLHSLTGDHLGLTYAEALGGGSGFYEMVSLRAPTSAFAQVDTSGARLWPSSVDRAALDPWYDLADQMLNVEQIAPELVPKSGLVFARLMKNLGYSCERARYAVKGCQGSGFCVTGCIYGAKQSLLITYLPKAVEAGAKIETGMEATAIRPLLARPQAPSHGPASGLPYRYEVTCRKTATRETRRYQARIVILGGGTLGTARLLMHSREQLPRLSDQLGRNIAFNGGVKTAGLLPEGFAEGDMFRGRSHPGMISYHFLASRGITISAAKPLPLQAVAAARIRIEGDPREPAWWGEANVDLMRRMRHQMIVMYALGMTLPLGRLALRRGGAVDIELPATAELERYHDETQELLHSIMRRNGCQVIETEQRNADGGVKRGLFFSSAHHVGSCRMADTPNGGVVSPDGEVFGYPGLYVSDGAAIPSSLAVNTSLTILANAERIAAGIVRQHDNRARAVGSTTTSVASLK